MFEGIVRRHNLILSGFAMPKISTQYKGKYVWGARDFTTVILLKSIDTANIAAVTKGWCVEGS